MNSLNLYCLKLHEPEWKSYQSIEACRLKIAEDTRHHDKSVYQFELLMAIVLKRTFPEESIQKLCLAIEFVSDRCRQMYNVHTYPFPYILQPLEVACILAKESPSVSIETLITAILGGILNNNMTSLTEIEYLFGSAVTDTIKELTFFVDVNTKMNRYQELIYIQKQLTLVPRLSYGATIILLAQKLYCLRNLPESWSIDRRCNYARFVAQLLKILEQKQVQTNLPSDYLKTLQNLESLLRQKINLQLQGNSPNYFVKSRL